MKKTVLAITALAVMFCVGCRGKAPKDAEADDGGVWTAFEDEDAGSMGLTGYRDKYGVTRIEPKFARPFPCGEFDNIIGVIEDAGEKHKRYYLTKAGKIVGVDSLYVFDNELDCETEGFIRFSDSKTDREGMFDRNGNVAVPAEYNYLGRVINGMIVALKGAERESADPLAEHNPWVGGEDMLIDTLNNVLIENFSPAPRHDKGVFFGERRRLLLFCQF